MYILQYLYKLVVWLKTILCVRSLIPGTYDPDRVPLSCTISTVCQPWNAAPDRDSSLKQERIIWKGWQNQHAFYWLSPAILGPLAPMCVQSIKGTFGDVGLKEGDAQFNQTLGVPMCSSHVPPFQRNDILGNTMRGGSPGRGGGGSRNGHMCICLDSQNSRGGGKCTYAHSLFFFLLLLLLFLF